MDPNPNEKHIIKSFSVDNAPGIWKQVKRKLNQENASSMTLPSDICRLKKSKRSKLVEMNIAPEPWPSHTAVDLFMDSKHNMLVTDTSCSELSRYELLRNVSRTTCDDDISRSSSASADLGLKRENLEKFFRSMESSLSATDVMEE